MNKITEIVYGNSLFTTMKKSNLNDNNIILFNTLFSISNLNNLNKYKLRTNIDINEFFNKEYNFTKEIKELEKDIKNGNKIRIWISDKDIEPYLLLLYICNKFKNRNTNLYVTFSDKINNCPTPSCLNRKELEELANIDQRLTKKEIESYSNIWINLVKINSPLRVIKNGKILSVDLDYFDEFILNILKEEGAARISEITAEVLSFYHIQDLQIVYFIDKLIEKKKIKIVEKGERHFLDKMFSNLC